MDDLDWDKGTRLLCNTSVASSSIGVNKPGMKHHSFVSNIMDQKETSADEHDSSRPKDCSFHVDRLSSLHPVALMIPPMPERPVGAMYSLWKRMPCWDTAMPRSLRVHATQSPDSTTHQAQ
ncbi:flavohemoglobin [Aspergillus luchuensis]|uniref:Flavohemoglobin n=1 Tax=Aspergillus kawachii TaxID=1069201 RepID=A0A146FBC9_ASPKA|nr:flavohemoglobin [Aspergillus luchuensis]